MNNIFMTRLKMRIVRVFILATFVSSSGLAGLLPQANDGQGVSAPVPLEDVIKALPIEEQSSRLTNSAERGFIFGGLNTPREFGLLASDKALHFFMDHLSEPLIEEWLDAFERLVGGDEYDDARFRAAVLLFRHGREAGREHLLALLRDNLDLRAARVLAVAREPGTEMFIVDAILNAPARAAGSGEAASALVRWRSRDLARQILAPEIRARFAERDRLPLYSALIGYDVDDVESINALRRAWTMEWTAELRDANRDPQWRSARAAQLLQLDPNNAEAREHLLEAMQRTDEWGKNQSIPYDLFRAIAATRDLGFVPDLIETISRLTTEREGETRDSAHARVYAAIHAVEAVVRLGGDVPPNAVSRLCEQLRLEDNYKYVARALLQTHNPEMMRRIQADYGEEEANRIIAIQRLRPVPDDYFAKYVPRSSRGWVWN